jgi:hypothetical protein
MTLLAARTCNILPIEWDRKTRASQEVVRSDFHRRGIKESAVIAILNLKSNPIRLSVVVKEDMASEKPRLEARAKLLGTTAMLTD